MIKRFNLLILVYLALFPLLCAGQDSLYRYSIIQKNGVSPVTGTGTVLSLSDDEVSAALPVGFTFKFFGNEYTQFYISSNGFITFSPGSGSGCCSGQLIPDATAPNNLISFAWMDLDPRLGGSIEYFTTGMAPSRRLVVNFNGIHHISEGTANTVQIVLYEVSNIIEIKTTNIPFSNNAHTMGVENSDGTRAYAVQGRNASSWAASNESVQFIPSFRSNDAGVSSVAPAYACSGTQPLQAVIQNYGGTRIDSVNVNWSLNNILQPAIKIMQPIYPITSGDSSRRSVSLGTRTFTLGQSYVLKAWTSAPNGVADSFSYNDTTGVTGTTSLQGTYTIGGTNPDFNTFSGAIGALTNYGICNPVVFNIRSGIYNEQVAVPQIQNAVGTNTITFQSESGNKNDVTIAYSANATNNYTLRLEGADNVIFKNLTFEAGNNSYGRVIEIQNGAQNNQFLNNIIKGVPVNSSDINFSVIYSPSGGSSSQNDNSNVFKNNQISGGSYGIYFQGYSSDAIYRETGLVLENNTFENQYYSGLFIRNQRTMQIVSNRISSSSNLTYFYGAYLEYSGGGSSILKNKINILSGYGIFQYGSQGTSGSEDLVANNFISAGGSTTAYGIYAQYASYINYYNNSIHISSTHATEGRAFSEYGSSNLQLVNNIFANSGAGYSVYSTGNSFTVSDYNDLYAKGIYLAYWNGINISSLASWKNASTLDEHSFSVDPLFVSSTDLHSNKALLNGEGTDVPEVSTDIDGETRQSPPDIGADEFTPSGENAELLYIQTPAKPFASGAYPVKVLIRNSGASVLTSLNVSWSMNNGVVSTYNWAGSLATGASDTVSLASFNYTSHNSYQIKAWVFSPNGTTDIERSNDTLITGKFNPALSGAYTIGGTSPDFTSFSQAAEALNDGGILSAVVFNVRNGTYNEQVNILAFPGSSCDVPVTFKSESGDSTAVILSYSSTSWATNYIFQLDGADGITVQGITIQSLHTSYSKVVNLQNGAQCNQFVRNIIQAPVLSSTSTDQSVIFSPQGNGGGSSESSSALADDASGNDNNNSFKNNLIRGGSYGIAFYGYNTSTSGQETGLMVEDNKFQNQYYCGIYLYSESAPHIKGNTIINTSAYYSFIGIQMQYSYSGGRIEKNRISTKGGYGIYFYDTHGIEGNEILVANNFVTIEGTSTAYGIYCYSNSYQNIYNNSVHISSTHTTEGKALANYYGSNQRFINNIFANTGGGYAIYFGTTSNDVVSNYNDLYAKGTSLGYWNGNLTDLNAWRSASGRDLNSVSTNPLFASVTDLHVNKALLHDAGLSLAEVTEDIDGQVRDSVPDIGADEFTPSGENIQLLFVKTPVAPFAAGAYTIKAAVKNSGMSVLTSLQVSWTFNAASQSTYHWTGSLAQGQTDTISLGFVNFNQITPYSIRAWAHDPNGQTDIDPTDDTIQVSKIYAALQGTYTIGNSSSSFTTLSGATEALNLGGILGAVTFNIKSGVYTEQISIRDFPGNSCDVPVTFQSETGDSTAVTLIYNSQLSNANYTLLLNGARGIVIRKLTLKSAGTTYGVIIDMEKGASCNKFSGNIIQGVSTTSTGTNLALLYSSNGSSISENCNRNTFTNNLFQGGSYGAYFLGYSTSYGYRETDNHFENNVFRNQNYWAINLESQQAAWINGNTITTNSTRTDFRGISARYCYDSLRIEKNKVVLPAGYGLSFEYLQAQAGSEGMVANNFVTIGGNSTAYGIAVFYLSGYKFYHNSVNITSSNATQGRAFYTSNYNGYSITLANNIFANTGGGYSMYADYSGGIAQSDNNDLYTSGTTLGYMAGNASDLAAWKSLTSKDQNSVSVNPQFLSSTDLHVSAVNLDGKGMALADVTEDIDGQLRSHTAPDMGADEFTTATEDAGIVAIASPVQPFPAGSNSIKAMLLNNATQDLNSVTIHWVVNGIEQPVYNWTGTITSGNNVLVNIGSFDFRLDSAYTISAWTSLPNNLPDQDPSNDTSRVTNIFAALGGTYTIGGDAPDFPLISRAVRAMSRGGVLDSVTFNIRTGTYIEQVSIPQITGAASIRPIVFKSETGVNTDVKLINSSTSGQNYTLQLNGADYFTFRDMTIEAGNTTYGTALDLRNGSSNNKFVNNVFRSVSTTNTATSLSVIYSPSGGSINENDHSNEFRGNLIEGGSYGAFYSGYSSSSSYRELGTIFKGNSFRNQYYIGLNLQNQDGSLISGNDITTASTRNDFYGILAQYCYSGLMIEKNKVNSSGGYGIYMYSCNGSLGSETRVVNNFISTGSNSTAYGFYLYYNDYLKVHHNTVNIRSTHVTEGRALYRYSGSNHSYLNNIFANSGGGYTVYHLYPDANTTVSDYNNYYFTGTALGYWSADQASLSNWKTITGKDAHSIASNPLFISATDLHVREVSLKSTGTSAAGVTDDIDGDARDSSPDIGADEFVPPANNDAGIVAVNSPVIPFPAGDRQVTVTLRNYGLNTINNVTIRWQLNNANQPDVNWTGSLSSGKEETVVLGTKSFGVSREYVIKAWPVGPNGQPDTLNYNDTIRVDKLYAALSGMYTIGGASPDFDNFTEAVDALAKGGILGPVTFNVRTGTYHEQISLPEIAGAASDKKIVFQSESGDSNNVILTFRSTYLSNYTVQLAGADYVTFRKMTIEGTDAYYGRVIDLRNNSSYNQFSGNIIRGTATVYAYSENALVYSPSNSLDEYNQFEGNKMMNGGYGFYYSGYNSSFNSKGTILKNNSLENQRFAGIFSEYLDAPKITGNRISTNTDHTDYRGIYLITCVNNLEIQKNTIAVKNGGYGIYMQSASAIFNIKGLIANNFISVGGTGTAYGLYLYDVNHYDIVYNSVNVSGTNATSGRGVYIYYCQNLNLLNNIFANTGGGYAIYNDYSSSVTISDYNDLYTAGANLGYISGNQASLAAWRNATGKDVHSVSADPFFYSEEDLHVSQVMLDSAGISVTGIASDIDGDARNASRPDIGADEFVYLPNDVGISAWISPLLGCGLDSSENVTVRISNYGGLTQTGFNVAYSVNGGAPVVENVGTLSILPGRKQDYTFSKQADFHVMGNYNVKAYTSLAGDLKRGNDTLSNVTVVNRPLVVAGAWNMIPVHNAVNVTPPVIFSWSPVQYADAYDLYVWADTAAIPAVPTVKGITQINYSYNNSLAYGKAYKWKIIARNACSEVSGPVQTFTLRNLPDLMVNNILVPSSGYSGQTIDVTWEIKNAGTGSTGSTQWYDAIYLSSDAVLDYTLDTYLDGVTNLTALNASQSYTKTATVTLPQGISGNYYIFIETNRYNYVLESNNTNNRRVSAGTITINLTPPPDLQVTSIITPENAFSGQQIDITWTVSNEGPGKSVATTWYDRLYLTKEQTFTGNGINLGKFTHNGALDPGASYTQTQTVRLPEAIFGRYYIYIQTDNANQVYEHVFEVNNTTRSDSVNVILTPPTDYVVTEVNIPATASNNQKVNIQWKVENQGGSAPNASAWTDAIYLAASPNADLSSAILLGTSYQSTILAPFENYTAQKEVTIPAGITGPYYIYVKTDIANQVFEHTHEDNNVLRSTNALTVLNADLVVSGIIVPATGASGQEANISWYVKNNGSGELFATKWTDRIYGSASNVFNQATARRLDSVWYEGMLKPGDSLLKQRSIRIPDGISGNYYIYIETDALSNVYEHTGENNNIRMSSSINVTLSPWPDLRVTSLLVPDTLRAGNLVSLSFRVTNQGLAATSVSSWRDKAYISTDSVWSSNAILLGEVERAGLLLPDSGYFASANMTLPAKLKKGHYYIYLVADGNNKVYEHTDENNNIYRSKEVYLKGYPPVDLIVTSALLSGTPASGKPLHVQWSIRNGGQASTLASRWMDGIYLSEDAIWDVNDKFISENPHDGVLKAGDTYDADLTVTLPNGVSGALYLLVVTDRTLQVVDANTLNNYKAAADTTGGNSGTNPTPIDIEFTPPPDLTVSSFTAPSTATSGQPVTVSWTVRNIGTGPTIKGSWTEKVYLSTDFEVSNNDIPLGAFVRNGNLNPGESYNGTLELSIPVYVFGNYIIILKTDNNNVEFEHTQENNNTYASAISIARPPLSDLIVSSTIVPDQVRAGESLDVAWTLRNIGQNPASGSMKEAVYFSSDSLWDINDVLVGTYDTQINIAPQGEKNRSITASVPGLPLGKYHLIVQTDIMNNIYESNDTNNVAFSIDKVDVTVRELLLNVIASGPLNNGSAKYYKLEVPPSLDGESILITLKGDSIHGANEVYIKHGSMPTRVVYDYSQDNPFQGNQEITIPSAKAGTYYLLLYGSTSSGTVQNVSLLARILNFEIRMVNAKKGGNTGKVTLEITGAKFERQMKVWLKRNGKVLRADSLIFINPVKVYATFDLKGAPLGWYDLLAENSGNDTAMLVQGFEVVPGLASRLLTNIVSPASSRPSNIVSMTIQFSNAGNTDIVNPVIVFNSAAGAPVGFTVAELASLRTSLHVPLKELNGPEGILRPGATGQVIIYSKAVSALSYIILLPAAIAE